MTIPERLTILRDTMRSKGWSAYWDTGTDPHDSEYPPLHWATREFLSGFTGSAGTVVVTDTEAGLWTDGRYFTQAEKELAGTGIRLFREGTPNTPSPTEWLSQTLTKGSTVGIDAQAISLQRFRQSEAAFKRFGLVFQPGVLDWSLLWPERPPRPANPVEDFQTKIPGITPRTAKLQTLRDDLKALGAEALAVTALDEIAWLLNLRGSDIAFTPVFLSWVWIDLREVTLFANVSSEAAALLGKDGVVCRPYDEWESFLSLVDGDQKVALVPERTNLAVFEQLRRSNLIETVSPLALRKARKSDAEIASIREAHRRDAAALIEFLAWFETNAKGLYEQDAADKLDEFRAQQSGFQGPSFAPIPGFGPNGAIIHYHPKGRGDALGPRGLFLLDTGAQYWQGTTDVTRTLSLGTPTPQEKTDYTLVLKAHAAVAMTPFPAGTRGYMIDAQARGILWRAARNYPHGTGHGVGHFLGVHEGPARLNSEPLPTALEPGMILSNEPGLYRPGFYGIRIENLVVCTEADSNEFGRFLSWETLTLCPYERRLIDAALLTEAERAWIDRYHQRVLAEIGAKISDGARTWLSRNCEPLALSGLKG